MSIEYIEAQGQPVSTNSLKLRRSSELAKIAESGRLAYVQLVECRQVTQGENDSEVVVLDVEVERPKHCVHSISRVERISVRFNEGDDWYPEVLALRANFPPVPHLNLRDEEVPRSLCLYDQPWAEIAIRLTATSFLERIRTWLAETAKGTLHQHDQPLEPVIAGSGLTVILPGDLYQKIEEDGATRLQVGFANNDENCFVLKSRLATGHGGGLPVLAICLTAKPRQQTVISKRPKSLKDLNELLEGEELLEQLRMQLSNSEVDKERKSRLLIVVGFPLLRDEAESVEVTDTWAFITTDSVTEVGIAIGLWMRAPGSNQLGSVMGTPTETTEEEIKLDVVATQFQLSRESAAMANEVEPDSRKVLAIGAGALGSQVIRLLAQSGFGTWTIVDNDWLAPHNTARHALSACWVGCSKAKALAAEARQLYCEETSAIGLTADFIYGSKKEGPLKKALVESDLILDISASVPVARQLGEDKEGKGRRASLFLNPQGSDLVLMFEDKEREFPLDCLEMQYYREIAFNDQLAQHLKPPANRIRYARSCRDVSSSMPNHFVAMNAAIAASSIRNFAQEDRANVFIWQSKDFPAEVRHVPVSISPVSRKQIGEWSLVLTEYVVSKLSKLREEKLPNETGGVFIGSFDLARRIVYVVDTIASPPDSKEWPTLYIRGSKGLSKEVDRITEVTDGQLEYVGEWHSHPDKASCLPSEDDLKVFSWLTENMDDAGLPALMAIAGKGRVAWFLGEIVREGGWETEVDE